MLLVGLTANLILVASIFMKWKSMKSLQTSDKILSCLAIFRGLYFLGSLLQIIITQFSPWLWRSYIVILTINILAMFIFYSSLWIATILCVFYCVKIVTYNYKLFTFLKTRISTMVPWLIPASLLISLIFSLTFGLVDYYFKLQKVSNGSSENMTASRLANSERFTHRFLIYTVGSIPPFMIFCVTNILLIHFLLTHTRRMRSNEFHIQSPNLQSHFNALKSMTLFLLLQIMLLICMSLSISGRLLDLTLSFVVNSIILCSPPLLHSLYMVYSSNEVKKMFVLMCLGLFR
ncbi:hypothetical protein GDO78_015372 [Eleutherodactylus coqui]|uniref:Taste receptor type 2 n=1 Tax=Eleutherodactylus coqui TaxID=57060 RepID=A0A8J6BE71_ELECQ|nr:hypothetical protein GDO78_015372 [Eleutherodactylus coqui]